MSLAAPSIMDYIEANDDWDEQMHERLFPVSAPTGRIGPFCVMRLKKEGRNYALDGPDELFMADLEFKFLSDSYRQVHELAALLSDILDGFSGPMGDIVVNSTFFMDTRDGESKDEVLDLYLVFCDVSVWYTRT